MDIITIHELSVPTHIGITKEERSKEQTLKVSVEISLDLSAVTKSDAIEDTINYEEVCNHIKELGKTERNTIEKFAEDTAQMILKDFKPSSVKVSVWKYILPDTNGVAVTIQRSNIAT